jgi:hypothetical protein
MLLKYVSFVILLHGVSTHITVHFSGNNVDEYELTIDNQLFNL